MANSEPNVLVPMTLEEAARRWLSQRSLCAIDWQTLEQLCEVYREHGSKRLIFDTSGPTYVLCDNKSEPHETWVARRKNIIAELEKAGISADKHGELILSLSKPQAV